MAEFVLVSDEQMAKDQGNIVRVPMNDADKAAAYRQRMEAALEQVAAIIQEAYRDKMVVSFHLSAPDTFGRVSVASLDILKRL